MIICKVFSEYFPSSLEARITGEINNPKFVELINLSFSYNILSGTNSYEGREERFSAMLVYRIKDVE